MCGLSLIHILVALSLILLSLLGTVAHATGLVDDTINAGNLYSKYPLSNYQLDFFVDNSWSWLPWNWLDGIGKSVQYGLYCITNFVWTISLYLSNATGYVVQEAYKPVSYTHLGFWHGFLAKIGCEVALKNFTLDRLGVWF